MFRPGAERNLCCYPLALSEESRFQFLHPNQLFSICTQFISWWHDLESFRVPVTSSSKFWCKHHPAFWSPKLVDSLYKKLMELQCPSQSWLVTWCSSRWTQLNFNRRSCPLEVVLVRVRQHRTGRGLRRSVIYILIDQEQGVGKGLVSDTI